MPQVPRYNQPQVDQVPVPSFRTSPNAPIEAFGGGRSLDRLTNEARSLAQTGLDIYAEEKRKADQIAVRDADLASARLSNDIELGLSNLKGRDAAKAPDLVNEQWAKETERIKSTLTNDAQRVAAEGILAQRRLQLDRTAQVHMASEFKKYDDEQYDNALKTYRADGSMKYNRPGAINGSLIQQEMEIDRYADRNKLPEEWRQRQKAVAKSATYRDVLERMLVDGNDKQAKEFEKKVNKDILPDDIGILEKVRKEEKIKRELLDAQYERGLYLTLADSEATTEQKLQSLDKAFRRGDMKLNMYEKAKGWVLDINDDPTISINKKVDVYAELTKKFLELDNTEVDKNGNPIAPAEGNDLLKIKQFRQEVAKNRKYLKPEQERNFQLYTESDYDSAREPKKNLFASLKSILPLLPNLSPAAYMDISNRAMAIFDKGVPVAQAADTINKLKEEAVANGNPRRTKYYVGQKVVNPQGIDLEVVGFDETGNPRFKVLK